MTDHGADNPFQSPVSADAVELRAYPISLFGGINAFLILACAGLLFVQPAIGVVAALLVGAALMRGVVHIHRGRKCGEAIVKPVRLTLISLLLMIPILILATITFAISGFAMSWVIVRLTDVLPWMGPYGGLVIVGLPVGLICGGITFVVLFLLTMPPRVADETVSDEFDR